MVEFFVILLFWLQFHDTFSFFGIFEISCKNIVNVEFFENGNFDWLFYVQSSALSIGQRKFTLFKDIGEKFT